MAKNKVGVHGTDEETGRGKAEKTTEKKPCLVKADVFMEKAEPIQVTIPGIHVNTIAAPKKFSSGSLGFFTNGKTVVTVDGKPCAATYQVQIILNNSKEAE